MPTETPTHPVNSLPNDPNRWSEEIRDYVARANLSMAVKRLIDFVREYGQDPELEDSVYVISMNYHQLEKEVLGQLVERGPAVTARNQIAVRILSTLRIAKEQLSHS